MFTLQFTLTHTISKKGMLSKLSEAWLFFLQTRTYKTDLI